MINFKIIVNINSYSLSLLQWEDVLVMKTTIIQRKVNNESDQIETESKEHTDTKSMGSILLPWLHASPQFKIMARIYNIWNVDMINYSRDPGLTFFFFFKNPNSPFILTSHPPILGKSRIQCWVFTSSQTTSVRSVGNSACSFQIPSHFTYLKLHP